MKDVSDMIYLVSSGTLNINLSNHHWHDVAVAVADHNNEKLMHVSVGSQSVWAVTDAGNIYYRTGVTQPLSSPLHPAWLCVNERKKSLIQFCQVVTSENDLVVMTQKIYSVLLPRLKLVCYR